MAVGLLLIRLVVGLTLASHGAQKLLGWCGGGGVAGTARLFEQMGFRPGRFFATLAGLSEVAGGLLLAAGLATPAAVAVVVAVMLVAVVGVHAKNGFFAHGGGFEYAMVLGVIAAALGATGPGALSLDALWGLGWSGPGWAASAILAGLIGGGVPLMLRARQATAAAATR
jgi:putative oxidoreductase